MKYLLIPIVLCMFLVTGCENSSTHNKVLSNEQPFNLAWKFSREMVKGAETQDFNDSGWRTIDLPHDWSIEDLPGADSNSQIGPFSKFSPGTTSTGYVVGGTGWYRKHFKLDPSNFGKTVKIYFDGVYNQSDVWVNGHHAGLHVYGYTPFYYDITEYLNPAGQENVIAVKVNNLGQNSRWYTGSGIYRNVKLILQDPIHIDTWSSFITTPDISNEHARIQVQSKVVNSTNEIQQAKIRIDIINVENEISASQEVNSNLEVGQSSAIDFNIDIENPMLWSVESPYLYNAEISVSINEKTVDTYSTHFGIRSIEFSAEKGFLLNGESLLLKGGCIHHDNGILGSAAFDRAETRRVEIMKANGFNALRTAHNPPSQAFLDACDLVGMLVIDESFDMWTRPKKPEDYSNYFNTWWEKDLRAMVLRDRNHPSIIIWSIGNEIPERGESIGYQLAKEQADFVKEIDPTRPVTNAICRFWNDSKLDWDATIPAFEVLEVGGYNYRWQNYESDHEKYPDRIMMGTESVALEAWDNWKLVEKHPYVIGDFVWTGMDYFGETGIGNTTYTKKGDEAGNVKPFPWFNAWCGDIDVIGDKKPQSYFRDIIWENSRINLFVHRPVPEGTTESVSFWGWPDEEMNWNWPGQEGKPMQVSVYSSFDSVQLQLNGKVIGVKAVEDSTLSAKFEVSYEPGELKATGLVNSREVDSKSIRTTGVPEKIILKIEDTHLHAERSELAFIDVFVTDNEGQVVPDVKIPVYITINGQGELLAAGSATPNHMESLTDDEFMTFRGRGLVIVRPNTTPGEIEIIAQADGMEAASLTIHTH